MTLSNCVQIQSRWNEPDLSCEYLRTILADDVANEYRCRMEGQELRDAQMAAQEAEQKGQEAFYETQHTKGKVRSPGSVVWFAHKCK